MWNTIIASINSMAIESMLEEMDQIGEISVCESGHEMLQRLSSGSYGLIICDEQMPDLDVWRLARVVATGSICPDDTRIIALRDEVTGESLARAKDHRISVMRRDAVPELKEQITKLIEENSRPTVLVVEDHDVMRDLVCQNLAPDYEVDSAPDGESGLRLWRERRHDLLVLDLMLPGMTGEDLLKQIRSEKPSQPAIILTAHATKERHIGLVLAGAEEFLEKPVSAEKLRESCARILRYSPKSNIRHRPLPNIRRIAAKLWRVQALITSGDNDQALEELRIVLDELSPSPITDDEWLALLG